MSFWGKAKQAATTIPPKCIPLIGTLGVDVYSGSDGVLLGAIGQQAVGKAVAQDYAAAETVLTDETAGANNATANDMTFFPASPAQNDAYYFGYASKFFGVDITIGTKAVSAVMTVVWEYWNGSAWATLTPTLDETSALLLDGTGAKKMRFVPPAAWAAKASLGTVTGSYYWIRARISEFTSIGTVPLGTRAYVRPLNSGTGLKWHGDGSIVTVNWQFLTKSGSTADSKFLLVNLTRGTCDDFTITKATASGQATGLNLGVAAGDQIALVQIAEDGSTEFANGWLELFMVA